MFVFAQTLIIPTYHEEKSHFMNFVFKKTYNISYAFLVSYSIRQEK